MTNDPFAKTTSLDDAVLEKLAGRFEARGENARFAGMLDDYLGAMKIAPDARVLDVGCGTGLVARAIARRSDFAGGVTGVDLSEYLVATADRLATEEGLDDVADFRSGDVRDLEFEDETFDAVVAHTLLSHVPDPPSVLSELARVTRPGGVVSIFDGDYRSLTFEHADPERGEAYDEALVDALVTNPRVMRRMPRHLLAAGFALEASFAYVLAEVGSADFWSSAIDAYRRLTPKAGAMTEAEADEWAEALRRDSEAGVFFGSCNYYAYVARRK